MPSFDVVSKLDWSEVKNALAQTQKELAQRFDFRGTGSSVERQDQQIIVVANVDERAKAAYGVFQDKLARRNVSLRYFKAGVPKPASGDSRRIVVDAQEGIESDKAKKIIKSLKESKLKVQASIQEDTVRVTGKKRDDLQAAMAELKSHDFEIELQFTNFRN